MLHVSSDAAVLCLTAEDNASWVATRATIPPILIIMDPAGMLLLGLLVGCWATADMLLILLLLLLLLKRWCLLLWNAAAAAAAAARLRVA